MQTLQQKGQFNLSTSQPIATTRFIGGQADYIFVQKIDKEGVLYTTDGRLVKNFTDVSVTKDIEALRATLIGLVNGEIIRFDWAEEAFSTWDNFPSSCLDLTYCEEQNTWLLSFADGTVRLMDATQNILFAEEMDMASTSFPFFFGERNDILIPQIGAVKIIPHPWQVLSEMKLSDEQTKQLVESFNIQFLPGTENPEN